MKTDNEDSQMFSPHLSTASDWIPTASRRPSGRTRCDSRSIAFITLGVIFAFIVGIIVGGAIGSSVVQELLQPCSGHWPGEAYGRHGIVTTTNTHATEIGLEILRRGGNAADAAVAIQFALGFVQPQSTGIGGGCFILHYDRLERNVISIDGREEAPAAYHPRIFCNDPACQTDPNCSCAAGPIPSEARTVGGLPVGVPGTVAAMYRYHSEFGSLPWADVVAPAAALARRGVTVTAYFNRVINANAFKLKLTAMGRAIFLSGAGGTAIATGDTFRNTDLATTYDQIATGGAAAFYGRIGAKFVADITAPEACSPVTGRCGLMKLDDLTNYTAVRRATLSVPLELDGREFTLHTFGMPSSGGTQVAMNLALLGNGTIAGARAGSALALQRIIDVQTLSFADRQRYMGDADFSDVPTTFLDPAYIAERRALLRDKAAVPMPVAAGTPPQVSDAMRRMGAAAHVDERGTTHFIVVDQWGSIASITSTVEANFGSGVVSQGFIANNELTDFDAIGIDSVTGLETPNGPSGARMRRRTALGADSQSIGGKRPRSTMSPCIVTVGPDNTPILAIGAPGGWTIAGAVTNVMANFFALGETLGASVAAPRGVSNNIGAIVEDPLNNTEVAAQLATRGLNVAYSSYLGYVMAVEIPVNGSSAAAVARAAASAGRSRAARATAAVDENETGPSDVAAVIAAATAGSGVLVDGDAVGLATRPARARRAAGVAAYALPRDTVLVAVADLRIVTSYASAVIPHDPPTEQCAALKAWHVRDADLAYG